MLLLLLKTKKSSSQCTIDVILQNILALCNLFDNVSFSFVKRDGNSLAHLLALRAAFCNKSRLVSISDPSLLVAQALKRDGQRPIRFFVVPIVASFCEIKMFIQQKKKKKRKEKPTNYLKFQPNDSEYNNAISLFLYLFRAKRSNPHNQTDLFTFSSNSIFHFHFHSQASSFSSTQAMGAKKSKPFLQIHTPSKPYSPQSNPPHR